MRLSKYKYPGSQYLYVICDICGRKFRQKDTIIIKDKYNFQNNLLVCKADADKMNPQITPILTTEKPIPNPEKLRPETPDRYITNSLSNRVPSKPQLLTASASPIEDLVELRWFGPQDNGSGRIIGYVISRASPQLAVQFIINNNTNSDTTYYKDIDSDVSFEYTYQVAAINDYGTGPFSDLAFYPTINVSNTINYLITSDTEYTITTGDNKAIILSL